MTLGALTPTPHRRASIVNMRHLGLHFHDIGSKLNLKTDACAGIVRHTTRDLLANEKDRRRFPIF